MIRVTDTKFVLYEVFFNRLYYDASFKLCFILPLFVGKRKVA